ncbi:LCP family protein [Actinophytocola sp.]|uniref:LCP family protein n=1 Tax=Actinophytocola sp. TaxID=1872138 RepID=UPI003D6A5452
MRRTPGPNDPTTYAAAVGSVREWPDDLEPVDEQERTPAPVRPRRRISPLLVLGRLFVGLVSAAVLAAMSMVYLRVDELDSSKNTTDALTEAHSGGHAPAPDDGANDILIVGNDSRTDMQGNPLSDELLRELRTEATEGLNTDTLILLRVPRDGGRGAAISIPRDTSVKVPGLDKEEKINGAFGITKTLTERKLRDEGETDSKKISRESDDAARTALIQSVQWLTGVRVDHYTEVSLYGFYLLTEVIDGVEVCLNQATSDPDSGAEFAAGPQTVRGGDAVSFVRQRKNLPRGDLDRIVRQQTFLASAMDKVLTSDVLTNNAKLNALEDAVSKTVVMDDGLHFLELVNQVRALASGRVRFVTIPVTGVGARNDRGQSIITVDVPAVHEYVARLVSGDPPAPAKPPSTPSRFGGPTLLDLTAPASAGGRADVPCVD